MQQTILSFKPATGLYGAHDPSAAIFRGEKLLFATEEERHTRKKHAINTFPINSIAACLDFADIVLSDIDTIVLPYHPSLSNKRFSTDIAQHYRRGEHPLKTPWRIIESIKRHISYKLFPDDHVEHQLQQFGSPIPHIKHHSHHRCHAASAFYPTEFEQAIVFTADGRGEYDSTVVWQGTPDGLERLQTYEYKNSLGHFFGAVTEFLGYESFNGEGKIMGLAPYGELNEQIERRLRSHADFGADYDVTGLLTKGYDTDPTRLERLFDRPSVSKEEPFSQFHKDLARTVQYLLEETVCDIIRRYARELNTENVCLAGGVALNCKLNKAIRELDCVNNLFIQPVANDAGLALGGGWLESDPSEVSPMTDVYLGPSTPTSEIEHLLDTSKIKYKKPGDVAKFAAKQLADGAIIGWFQSRQEMGPRALGNRSILADPRTVESRDKVNKFVKHREEWRPFAPSMLESAADEYLIDYEMAPFMIQTFDTVPEKQSDIEAAVHPEDRTTRPQTVRKDQNPRYYQLISEFNAVTGVPVILNTSFNDSGEPIVTTPREALKDFYSMGLDTLVLGDIVVEK